jgi:hypothetical protein
MALIGLPRVGTVGGAVAPAEQLVQINGDLC